MPEKVLSFESEGESLMGILSEPVQPARWAVLILVGGPQYRVGSHRQFVSLARALSRAGVAAFRFDFQGMGDSSGALQGFEHHGADIRAAADAVMAELPDLAGIVLWGLCDAASAALLYMDERADARIRGLVLVNPWVRSEHSLAQAHLALYYRQRLRQPEFWKKLLSGRVAWRALTEWGRKLAAARAPVSGLAKGSFQHRMALAWRKFGGRILLISASADLTAREFDEALKTQPDWQGALNRPGLSRVDIADADHTFSRRAHQDMLERATADWVLGLDH